NEISTSMTDIERNLNATVKKAEQETRDLVSNAKHGALVPNIIDALKYGAATSAITVPVLNVLLSSQKDVAFISSPSSSWDMAFFNNRARLPNYKEGVTLWHPLNISLVIKLIFFFLLFLTVLIVFS